MLLAQRTRVQVKRTEKMVLVLVRCTTVVKTVVDEPEPIVYVTVAASTKVEVLSELPAAVIDGWLGEPVLRGTETAASTPDGLDAAVAAAVEINEDRLAGRGTAGDEYGDNDIVAGQTVV